MNRFVCFPHILEVIGGGGRRGGCGVPARLAPAVPVQNMLERWGEQGRVLAAGRRWTLAGTHRTPSATP
eukprot:362161-Chlamydomonas_euryale.AAC.1